DGHGLNELLEIESDEPDQSGAAHRFTISRRHPPGFLPDVVHDVARIQFQKGPRHEAQSISGVTEAAVIAVLIDRIQGFQKGPFACRENALALTKLQEALFWTRHRADERAQRGVLG